MKVGFVALSLQLADYWDHPWHFVLTLYLALFGLVRDWTDFIFCAILILSFSCLRGFSVVVLNHSKDGADSPSTFLVKLHSKTFIFLLVFVVSWDQLNLGSDLKLDWHERNLQCRSKTLMRDP
jgi:hypothetical protein